ncbi:MAG: DUF4870 domain-containing protein [Bacteroidetes bacterium]|nr:DUF4870 domain-containing protein [Bacteroidota bacterium]
MNNVEDPTLLSDDPAAAAHESYKKEQDERSWAMLCHLAVFSSVIIPFGHIIGPLVVWMVKKEQFPLVADQGRESLNFQISMTIYTVIILIVFVVSLLGFIAGDYHEKFPTPLILSSASFLVLGLVNLVMVIIAAVRAYKGERYRYPLSIHFVS